MRAAPLTREELKQIRLNRYRKRASVQRAASKKRRATPLERKRVRVLRTSGLSAFAWAKRKTRRKMALESRRRNRA